MLRAKSGVLKIGTADMEYIRFGTGRKDLVMLPGLGDGLRSVKGTALPFGLMYRLFARDFTVWAFSRVRQQENGSSTRDMARDVMQAMQTLGIRRADVLGVSMGGMIAQHLAADYPQMVDSLVLTVTCPRPNPILTACVQEWMDQARAGDHRALMDSNLQKIYSPAYYRSNKWMIPLVAALTKPRSYDRFLAMAQACLTHDAWERLPQIRARTLVIGGGQDACLGGEASRELAQAIPGARLKMYPQWGHGLYEEAKDFNRTVLAFLRREDKQEEER